MPTLKAEQYAEIHRLLKRAYALSSGMAVGHASGSHQSASAASLQTLIIAIAESLKTVRPHIGPLPGTAANDE